MIKNVPYKYHDYSRQAAAASLAAGEQGKYWEMHDLLLERSPRLDRTSLVTMASELKLDVKRFAADIDDPKRFGPALDKDLADAASLEVSATPTYFVNGRKIVGNRDLDFLKGIVNEELAGAKR